MLLLKLVFANGRKSSQARNAVTCLGIPVQPECPHLHGSCRGNLLAARMGQHISHGRGFEWGWFVLKIWPCFPGTDAPSRSVVQPL